MENENTADIIESTNDEMNSESSHSMIDNSTSSAPPSFNHGFNNRGQGIAANLDYYQQSYHQSSESSSSSFQSSTTNSGLLNQMSDNVSTTFHGTNETPSSESINVVFHVHLPPDIEKRFEKAIPCVIGNIDELGKWEFPIVKLKQHSSRWVSSTYWVSDPVTIPVSNFVTGEEVRYLYAIYIPKKQEKKKNKDDRMDMDNSAESNGDIYRESDYRVLRNQLIEQNQFDIVNQIRIEDRDYLTRTVHDFEFLNFIWQSLTPNNTITKLFEYLTILNQFEEYTKLATNQSFIVKCLESTKDRDKEKRVFLCILLGYYIYLRQTNFINDVNLHQDFPSSILLECLDKFQPENWLHEAPEVLLIAFHTLIRHNISQNNNTWLKRMFALAPLVDPEHHFIDIIAERKNISLQKLSDYLPKYVIPYANNIEDPRIYAKVGAWLIRLCKDMDQLFKVWEEIINHTEERDILLKQPFLTHVHYLISDHKSAKALKRHYDRIPNHFREKVSEAFRQKSFKLLSSPTHPWDKRDVEEMFIILKYPEFNWNKSELLEVLHEISKSNQWSILCMFLDLLSYWFQFEPKEMSSEKIPAICSQWFQHILDHTNENKEKYVYIVFSHLSKIFPKIEGHLSILFVLVGVAIDRVKQCPEERILNAVRQIDFQQDIVQSFLRMVKDILRFSVKNTDDTLIKKIKLICDCNSDVLNVPNASCEAILRFIMDRLKILHPLADVSDSNITSTSLTLLRSSKFWNFILQATGKVSDLNAHPYIRQIKNIINEFIKIIKKNTITIRSLQQLLKYDDESLIRFFNSNDINQEDINILRTRCGNYEEKLTQFHHFYTQFCPIEKIKGVDKYLKNMEQRSKCDTLTLQETLAENHWVFHKITENAARKTFKLANLQTFRNIFNQKINGEEEIKIDDLAQIIIPSLVTIYEEKTMKYKTSGWESLHCAEESIFWNNVKDVKAELDLMNLKADERLIKTLTYVSRYPIYVERLQQLNEVVSMFKVTHTKEDWIETQLKLLSENYLWLGKLNDFFEYHDRSLSSVNENCWELIKSLSLADEFIRFLQSVAEHDITNMVKKFLLPLLKNVEILKPKTFLKKLCEITEQNPVLGQKITLCNSNRKALENMYKNINNRTEVTQERIINAVRIGTYTFKRISNDDKCTAILTYPINSLLTNSDSMDDKDEPNEKPYTLNDLQDLRGRALLIAKPGVIIDMEISEKEQEQQERAKKIMNEFVIQVDFAQEIINVASKLIQIGHFNYRDFNKSVKGTENMQKLLNELNKHLIEWEDIVDRAQKEHYYLTFFPARHILAFHDYFNDNAKDKIANKEECQILVTFVNNAARLPPPQPQMQMEMQMDISDDIHASIHDYYNDLCNIGSKLADIFESIPKQIREIKDAGERVKSDIVQPGKLFVAACSNKSFVPNIIMSLYANHKAYPQPWQILICTSSTTMEELSIFTKRCFFAPDNGYEGHLFCIANLELVDFELQYNLVNNIRSMSRMINIKDKFLLALICCKESEVQYHILDQFSQDIHVTNGLDVDAMKGLYQELCPDVKRVSSELSGQGKTEWIKTASFEKQKLPRSFLISDGVDFGTLVKRLKEHKIRPVESLHLNIVSADNPGDINLFLFELLTLGMVSNYTDIVCLPNTPIFIEVATTVGQYLLKSLPFVECLSSEHITWDISNLSVSLEIDNPIQIVCHYLEADEKSTIEEEDLLFNITGTDVTLPLPESRCRELIKKYLFDDEDESDISSYRFVEIFIKVLANQLVGLSLSSYFRVDNLKLMTREKDIRKTLVNTLLTASKDFAIRSVKTKEAQLESITPLNDDRLGTIVQWEDSNHLLVFFLSQAPDSICALYRNAKKVPDNVTKLLQSQCISGDQKNFRLEDYNTMDMSLLLNKLESLARKSLYEIKYPRYALSADNLIKMALILLRSRASIPVVVCGEAGCGKTSLIGFLSKVVEVKFHALNLHAGISEEIIKSFMTMVQNEAQEKETWIFFDEINTCNHMGLLSELVAHRRWLGKEVHYNIRIFAACNPYRKRTKSQSNVGLKVQQKIKYEEKNELVYQVKPLPDQILDYVWDYGILQALEEEKYIQIMVSESLGEYEDNLIFAKLLAESQRYIRHIEEPYSVSLRDVKRAITLVKFFAKSLTDRPQIRRKNSSPYPNPEDGIKFSIRCYVLSLGLCYQCRMYEQSIRQKYREKMARLLLTNGIQFDETKFSAIIRQEQEDYINRMICPPNTAHNEALLENVLVMIVCILTKIPVFIIGAPGSSKSLAIRLVSQNLKGSDSNDKYFQELPQVYLIPYQGSTSSTSDGIIKVFEKAVNYQNTSSKEFKIISVVLLDEVGLAETSPFNPLKVLHSLLEPSYPSDGPAVAFIGISNWRLDNSKSSRALLVQRPKFDLTDLIDTAVNLLGSKTNPGGTKITSSSLKPLADAYSSYEQTGQLLPNFHGLRDYYALVKSLSLAELTPQNIQKSLVRNFGGTGPEQTQKLCEHYFGDVFRLSNDAKNWEYTPIPVEELINANLDDEGARHLMVIGKSDSIVSLLTYQLRSRNLDPVIILGSQFPDDRDDYSYSVLSRIMMCVEAGRPLILTDLEIIYGSLYDLWNQNYIVVGSADDPKYYTRVALGAYANPMLFVNKTFRCILVLDEKKLETADPPLLNRFEKQKMTINNILTPQNIQIVEQLSTWVTQMSKVFGGSNSFMPIMEFKQKDLFIGFDPDETLQSLVIDITKRYPDSDDASILQKCKERLIAIASSDGIIRAEKSGLDADEIKFWKNTYYNNQCHDDLATYIQSSLDTLSIENDSDGLQVIINTFSNINTDIETCLKDIISCQVDKLSTFKTEAQLQNRVKHFWLNSAAEMLILQCDITTISAGCIKLAKFIIEQFKNDYLIKKTIRPNMKTKHSCIILHIHREQENSLATFNFMCGWDQITIETLSQQEISLSELLDKSLNDVINTTYKFEDILKQELLWCLLCMKYPSNIKSIEHIKTLSSEICNHPILLGCIKACTQQWLQEKASKNWQYDVASNKKLLYRYPSFLSALQAYIKGFVRRPIAKALCALERLAATKTFFSIDKPSVSDEDNYLLSFWLEMFNDKKIINIEEISEPSPDLYNMPPGVYDLQFPFSYYFMELIDNFRPIYQEEMNMLYQNPNNVNKPSGELKDSVINEYLKNFTDKIRTEIPLLKTSPLDRAPDLYFKDFASVIACNEPGNKDPELLRSIFERRLGKEKVLNPINLHTYWWIHGNSIMAELHLAHICPTIAPELQNKSGDAITLVKEAIEILLTKISKDEDTNETYEQKEIDQWKYDATKILSFSKEIPKTSTLESLQLLQFCNDLLSISSIRPHDIKRIISLAKNSVSILATDVLNALFGVLDDIESTEINLMFKRMIILRCLDIIPFESDSRIWLYRRLFTTQPFPLMGVIVQKIFETEVHESVFFQLIKDQPRVLTFYPRLQEIDKYLSDLDLKMATLCCDIIQHCFFAKLTIETLVPYFSHALRTLSEGESRPLQRISAIAFLKEFVRMFFDVVINDGNNSVAYQLDSIQGVNGNDFLHQIIEALKGEHSLIYSLRIYFLRDLRRRGYSFDEVKRFCKKRPDELPWLIKFHWESSNSSRFPINPYWHLSEYSETEIAYANLRQIGNKVQIDDFLEKVEKGSMNSRLSLIGLIVMRLHAIRASHEWDEVERQLSMHLNSKINEMDSLPDAYKQTVTKLLVNTHDLYKIEPDTENSNLIMKSVLIYIVGLHASMNSDFSPLTAYLQEIQKCGNMFILTCQSDEESALFNAVATGGVSRYQCQCGFKYVIGNCGQAAVTAKCPGCGNTIVLKQFPFC
ncbi:e3 ubiquitin-protein ligase [Gigaspora margarita]|uniref:E3 ubiquitin-protein ligase n=2 Tax=Gigaspora margarita TaxID=4874 RepID=A0A8H4ABT8_GIGMA|nr:e3 ubiquitin-protein ligase [Gigaspora margarita]